MPVARKTKIVCTLGPACWSDEGLAALMDAGMNVARFNFSHGDHAGHKEVLDRVRKVAAAKGRQIAVALDTKGPEIRTAMLRDGKDILLEEGAQLESVEGGRRCHAGTMHEAACSWGPHGAAAELHANRMRRLITCA